MYFRITQALNAKNIKLISYVLKFSHNLIIRWRYVGAIDRQYRKGIH